VLLAERADERSGASEAWPRHAREQVMSDLVVGPAEKEVGQPTAVDVAGSEDLASEVVRVLGCGEHEHAFVVGRERQTEIAAEQSLKIGPAGTIRPGVAPWTPAWAARCSFTDPPTMS
jgi:hypothetical protein